MQQSLLTKWVNSLRTQRRLSPHTTQAYQRDVRRLFALQPDLQPEHYQSEHIRQSLAQLHAQGEQPRSLARRLSAWRHFFTWYGQQQDSATPHPNPCDGVRAPKAPQPLPRALSVEQTQQLLDNRPQLGPPPSHPSHAQITAYRDQALFELFYSSGLRLSELVDLDYQYINTPQYRSHSWLNLDEGNLRVQGKGQKSRYLPIGRLAKEALRHWLQLRPLWLTAAETTKTEAAAPHQAALFLGRQGRRINPRVVQQRLAQRAQQAGLSEHVHPHRLRHSFASHLLQSSQDLRAVQELLGHQNIRSTQIYTRLDFQHLAQIYDQSHPRARKSSPTTTEPTPAQVEGKDGDKNDDKNGE